MTDHAGQRMSDKSCPRCGKSPVEVTAMGEAEPRYLPACPCYPHPPQCITCGTTIENERCPNVECFTFDVLQSEPVTDPLWKDVAP